ncbi:MAG: hypothetical protein R6U01_13585 [Halorubrum sp.]|uniref:DUF7527 domain-containing protein n=1 Tax=Halorubrum sp. TaxID=1879286 RepID=UPI003970BEA8
MDAQRRTEITGWDARDFSDGFAGLRRHVSRGFSGAVTDGAGWLFVFEGRVVGAADADLEDFAEASGTLYEAPEAVLPVLFAMQEQAGEPRAQYYTNDTPLSEADRTLSRGGFTGYVELSENVLSGDYYVTYTAGESMAAAYVGNSRRLETGEEAFSLADDEVGIYTVYEVDLTVREIPSDADASASASAAADQRNGESDEATSEGVSPEEDATSDGATSDGADLDEQSDADGRADPETQTAGGSDAGAPDAGIRERESTDGPRTDADAQSGPDFDADDGPASDSDADDGPASDSDADDGPAPVAIDTSETDGEAGAGSDPSNGARAASTDADEASSGPPDRPDVSSTTDSGDDETSPSDDVFSEEEQWREQKSIPALDPSEASDPPSARTGAGAAGRGSQSSRGATGRDTAEQTTRSADDRSPEPRSTGGAGSNRSAVSQSSRRAGGRGSEGRERLRKLERALKESEREREELSAELEEVAADRDDAAAERDELAGEVDRLASEVSTLREERDRLRDELARARERLPETDRTISPTEARSGTNLFVRYDSKGGATLEDAHDGSAGRDELRENLRIEHHTSFETDGLAVDGQPFEEFLRGAIEYGFTRWIVEDLPFEVSGTGNQGVLRDLYDAIPEIDRAEIGGSVSIVIRENGEETREQRAFDLVLRDRMGNPLFVADLNDSRDPTEEGTLESLVGNGRDIAESNDSFAGAFAVTESFFEPGALETASDAVGGGLFSRSKRASYVKLSRKQGYHLCLVEARDGGFHMTVPDL